MKGNLALFVILLASCGDVVKKDPTIDAPEGTVDAAVDGSGPDSSIDAPPAVAPTISAMTPDWGSSAGGTNVKITGTGFSGANLVVQFGTANATGVNVVSDTEVRVVTPPGPNARVVLKVTTAGGSASFGTQFRMFAPLYAGDGRSVSGNLYTVNPQTGAFVSVGAIGHAVTGLAFSPSGVLYGAATDTGQSKLITIDPYTAASTVVGAFMTSAGAASGVHDLTFEGNRLLGWKGLQMVEVNALSGQVTLYTAGLAAGGGGCGVASRTAGTMYFTPQHANQPLFIVNTATGAATAGPTMNGPAQTINSLTYVGNTMFGSVASPGGAGQTTALYSIDPSTGATQLRGALPPAIDAIAGIPAQPAVPLPPPPAPAPADAVAAAPQEIAVAGQTIAISTLLDRAAEITVDGKARKVVPLTALRGRGNRIVLVDAEGRTRTVAPGSGLALSPNQRGELKLVDPRAGFTKLFGPVTQIRWTN